jgi:hypothetical protein
MMTLGLDGQVNVWTSNSREDLAYYTAESQTHPNDLSPPTMYGQGQYKLRHDRGAYATIYMSSWKHGHHPTEHQIRESFCLIILATKTAYDNID